MGGRGDPHPCRHHRTGHMVVGERRTAQSPLRPAVGRLPCPLRGLGAADGVAGALPRAAHHGRRS